MPPALINRVKARWHASTEEHRSILRTALSVAAFSLVGKLATAAKDVVVAWRFGVSAVVDAYLFVFNLCNWAVLIWFSVLTVVLIPLEGRVRRESPEQLAIFRRQLLGATLVAGLIFVVVADAALPLLLRSRAVGLPAPTVALALQTVPGLAWLLLLGPLVALYSTWMMSGGRNANTLLEGVPQLGILAAVLITGGIESLVVGTLVGVVIQLACVAWPRIRSHEVRAPAFGLSAAAWGPFAHGFGLVLIGQVILGVSTLVDQFYAAGLGVGAISSMGYATRILGLLNTLVAITVTRATLPVFSRAGPADAARIRRIAFQWAALLALVGALAAVAGLLFGPWIVRLLFERGTFTAGDTSQVATLLRFGVLQLPFYFASLVFVSLHSSRGRYRVILLSGVVGVSVKLLAIWLLVGALGLPGLMMSTALMYLANTVLLLCLA